ncbi:hypothetical protein ACWX0P_03015 [Vibrio mediterranei]
MSDFKGRDIILGRYDGTPAKLWYFPVTDSDPEGQDVAQRS